MVLELCDLPEELLAWVVEQLEGDLSSLRALTRTSYRFQDLAEPILYRHLLILRARQAERLLEKHDGALRPGLGDADDTVFWAVQSIDARLRVERGVKRDHVDGMRDVAALLWGTPNLRELTFEMPGINERLHHRGGWRGITEDDILRPIMDAALYRQPAFAQSPALSALKKLTLHMTGLRYRNRSWALTGWHNSIFAHPSIEDLTLSCATIHGRLCDLSSFDKTRLRKLTLIECNVTQEGFQMMLSMPRALEYLYLGENANHYSEMHYPRLIQKGNFEKFIAAFGLQRHTLKEFWYRSGTLDEQDLLPQSRGFSDFGALETFGFASHYRELEELITKEATKPPNLTTINIRDYFGTISYSPVQDDPAALDPDESPLLRICELTATLKTLKKLNVTTPARDNSMHGPLDDREQHNVEMANRHLKPRGVRLTVTARTHHGGVIPPYLYGEQEPTDSLVFDSDLLQGWLIPRLTLAGDPVPADAE